MTDLCAVDDCDRPVGDAPCCTHCAWRLKHALGDVAALEEDLPIVLAKLTRYTDQPDRIKHTATPALPFHDPASEAAWILRNTLTTWTRIAADERGWNEPEGGLADMAEWLTIHVEWFRHHRAGHDAIEEILSAVTQAWRVTDRPSTRARFEVGACPDCDTGTVWAHIPANEDRPATMACSDTECGAQWSSPQFLNAGKRIVHADAERLRPYVSSSTAAAALGVTDRTIRRWCVEGLLTNHGTPGRILLDLAEIEHIRPPFVGVVLEA